MGRSIHSASIPLTHPSLALPLLALWIAAVSGVLAALCVSRFRKPKQPSPTPSLALDKPLEDGGESVISAAAAVGAETTIQTGECDETHPPPPPPPPPLPPPPMMYAARHGSFRPAARKTTSRRTYSLRIPEGLSRLRTGKKESRDGPSEEDSIWKKTIILGEKCRVQSDDEEEDAGGGGGRGTRQRDYHPITPRSLPVSRSNSFSGMGSTS